MEGNNEIKGLIKAKIRIGHRKKRSNTVFIPILKNALNITIIEQEKVNSSLTFINNKSNINTIFPRDDGSENTKIPFMFFSTEKGDKIYVYNDELDEHFFICYFVITSKIDLENIPNEMLETISKKLKEYKVSYSNDQEIFAYFTKDNELIFYKQKLIYTKKNKLKRMFDETRNKLVFFSGLLVMVFSVSLLIWNHIQPDGKNDIVFLLAGYTRLDFFWFLLPFITGSFFYLVSWWLNTQKDSFKIASLDVSSVLDGKPSKAEQEMDKVEEEKIGIPKKKGEHK